MSFLKKRLQKSLFEFYKASFDYNNESLKHRFIVAVHLRCPFRVSFITSDLLSVAFDIGVETYSIKLSLSEFESIMSYALMHIDDLV